MTLPKTPVNEWSKGPVKDRAKSPVNDQELDSTEPSTHHASGEGTQGKRPSFADTGPWMNIPSFADTGPWMNSLEKSPSFAYPVPSNVERYHFSGISPGQAA